MFRHAFAMVLHVFNPFLGRNNHISAYLAAPRCQSLISLDPGSGSWKRTACTWPDSSSTGAVLHMLRAFGNAFGLCVGVVWPWRDAIGCELSCEPREPTHSRIT